jgi:hypothetical protein
MQTFPLGYRLMDEDLNITFQRKLSFAYGPLSSYDPYILFYEIGTVDSNLVYTRKGPLNRIPYEIRVGHFRANFIVGDEWPVGNYRIIWSYQVCQQDPVNVVSEDFQVATSYSRGSSSGLSITLP